MKFRGFLLVAAIAAFAPRPFAGAQVRSASLPLAVDSALSPTPALCFRGAPRPDCGVFTLTEVAFGFREFGDRRGSEHHLQWELGAMVNLDRRNALGAGYFFGEPKHGQRGVNVRYRRWLSPIAAVDFAPGVLVIGDDYDGRRLRLTTHAALSMGDLAGFFAQGESNPEGGQLTGGAKLGSWLGMVVGIATYTLLLLIPET